jgi:hypothetical protein
MKVILLSTLLLSSAFQTAFAAGTDSMVVFAKPAETLVLINENHDGQKLNAVMNAFTQDNQVNLKSVDGNISIQCKRATATSCTFRFAKSDAVELSGKSTFVYSDAQTTAPLRASYVVIQEFENQQGDTFTLFVDQFQIAAEIRKK